jgi:SOS response regulatory protein OraA/RecX
MARPEPDAASSSPSARLRVQSIRRSGTIGERLSVALSDGSSFSFPESALQERGLSAAELAPGVELDAGAVAALTEVARASAVHERALRLLAASAHTKRGLQRKLLARGTEPALVEAELARLAVSGLLDDGSYAASWVRLRLARHPEGAGPLLAGLQRRGVPRELAEQAVREQLTGEAEREAAAALAEKLRRRSDMIPEKLESTLGRRGFRRSVIREVLGG